MKRTVLKVPDWKKEVVRLGYVPVGESSKLIDILKQPSLSMRALGLPEMYLHGKPSWWETEKTVSRYNPLI